MKPPKKLNKHEEALNELLIELFTVPPTREHRFMPKPKEGKQRQWRFDFAYVDQKIAFEVEGGTWSGGRHVHPIGFAKDCEKYNAATARNWRIYRLTPAMIDEDYLIDLLTLDGLLSLK